MLQDVPPESAHDGERSRERRSRALFRLAPGRANGDVLLWQRRKVQRGFVGVVRATAQFDIGHRRRPVLCKWHDVMQLEEASLLTSPTASDKRAASLVAPPHLAPDCARHVSGAIRDFAFLSWTSRVRELLALEILEQDD